MQRPPTRAAAFTVTILGSLAAILSGACDGAPPTNVGDASLQHSAAMHAGRPSEEALRQIAGLRARTAAFHRFDAAVAAGWTSPIPGCFSDPQLGGMGFHYGNPDLIDGSVDEMEPELLVYEPEKNGRLRLVAVEYIVPLADWTSPEPPRLYGRPFMWNDTFQIWALHVWHFRENPRGVFADYNPKVTCEHAP